MTDNKVFVFDVGTLIEIDMTEDLSTLVSAELHVQKPDGSEVIWPANAVGNILEYLIQSGDLDIPGRWIVQPFLLFIGSLTWEGHGDPVEFEVYPEYALD